MSRISEYAAEIEQENLSGMDMCEAWHEHNRRILNEIGEVTDGIVKEDKIHKERMAQLGITEGFNVIFKGDQNGRKS